jgi:hypothetical protein
VHVALLNVVSSTRQMGMDGVTVAEAGGAPILCLVYTTRRNTVPTERRHVYFWVSQTCIIMSQRFRLGQRADQGTPKELHEERPRKDAMHTCDSLELGGGSEACYKPMVATPADRAARTPSRRSSTGRGGVKTI